MERYHVYELEELILLKWPYSSKQYIDLMQSLLKYHGIFHRSGKNNFEISMELKKMAMQSWEKRKRLKVLYSDFRLYYTATTIKQNGAGTKVYT